uniref:Uncharacterized protein n=1 Tax=Oryza glumipatula TaxID=40148 RepID=A0A0E0AAM0_9ORYZ
MDYLRCGGSHVLIGIRGPREDTVEFLDHVITRWVIYQPYNILLMEETFKAFRGGRCIRHLRSLEVVATFTNAVLWAGTHNPQMTNFSRPCMISTCTQTTGRRFSGFFSLVYWDHDGDDILQGNHITVGQRRKKETGRKVRGIDIDQEEDSLFLLCCLM